MQDTKGSWHKFYFDVVVAQDNVHMKHSIYNRLKKNEEWTEEKIEAFWKYH